MAEPREPTRIAYSVTEVAQLLGVSRQTVYTRIYDGEIPYRRLGGKMLIPAEFVEEFGKVAR